MPEVHVGVPWAGVLSPDLEIALIRQRIESIFTTAKRQLSRNTPAPAPAPGSWPGVGQRLLALAAAICHNWAVNAPVRRSLTAYDH